METITLTDWVPVLAKEIHGKKWSPNCDMITHLEAQQEAKKLGIQWAKDMTTTDVTRLCDAMLNRHGK